MPEKQSDKSQLTTDVESVGEEAREVLAKRFLSILENRFSSKPEHYKRVEGVNFAEVEKSLEADPALIYSLARMEETGGEPDIIAVEDDAFIFADCSSQTPEGRINCVYDKEAEKGTKGLNGNAVDMAKESGVELVDRQVHKKMQEIGKFDSGTWSFLKTPDDIREGGYALYGYSYDVGTRVIRDGNSHNIYGGWRGVLRVPMSDSSRKRINIESPKKIHLEPPAGTRNEVAETLKMPGAIRNIISVFNKKPDEISHKQWMDLLHMTKSLGMKKNWINNNFTFEEGDIKFKEEDLKFFYRKELKSLPERLSVRGKLDLFGCSNLKAIPGGLKVGKSLYLNGCTGLRLFPEGVEIGESLDFNGCTGLTSLPEKLELNGYLDLTGCTGLTSLPKTLSVGGCLILTGCTGLTSLPKELNVQWSLILNGCTGLKSIPKELKVGKSLYLNGCTGLTSLPEGLDVKGDLGINGCTGLTSLPEGLNVEGDLGLTDCAKLRSLPEKFKVKKGLYLNGCTGLTSLPNGLEVMGSFDLRDCTGLMSLPDELRVNGSLYLWRCTGLTSLPKDLSVVRNLFLSKDSHEQVKKDAERLNAEGKIGGEIKYV